MTLLHPFQCTVFPNSLGYCRFASHHVPNAGNDKRPVMNLFYEPDLLEYLHRYNDRIWSAMHNLGKLLHIV
nr:MAG TPA: hypothetical protein [Caudoviricetes sp.]